MFYERPRIDTSSGAVGGAAATTAEIFEATRQSMHLVENAFSRSFAMEAAYDARLDEILKATGQRHFNPMRYSQPFDEVSGIVEPVDPHKMFQIWLEDLQKQYPQHAAIIRADRPIEEDARELARQAEERALNVWARAEGGFADWTARIAGGFAGMTSDPINWLAMMAGPWGQAGAGTKGLLWMGLKVGAANAASEVPIQPLVQLWRKEAGLDYGLDIAATNIAAAGVFGFGLDAGVRSIVRGGRRLAGRPYLGPPPDPKKDPTAALEWAAQNAPDDHVLKRAANGDADALRTIARETGQDQEAAVRGGLKALDAEEIFRGLAKPADEIAQLPEGLGARVRATVSQTEHDLQLNKAIRHAAGDPGAPPPGHAVAAPAAKPGPDLGDSAPARLGGTETLEGRPVHFVEIDPAEVTTDAATFQFKSEGDVAGVTPRLRGVKRWDPLSAGKTFVFERLDGTKVIADGHQRLGLAKRLADQNPRLHAYVFREADGWTPADVRAHAALKNMRELSGSSLDMAKVMRERPDLIDDSIPLSDGKMREAVMLARLSPEAFDAVVAGRLPPSFAALLGEHVTDSARHAGLLNEIAAADLANPVQARFYLRQLMELPTTTETQITLFGEEIITRTLMAERSRVLDSSLKTLKSDKRIFAVLDREAGRIEGAGNVLDREGNAVRAQNAAELAELIERLSTTRGVVAQLLNDAAIAVSNGLSAAQASRAFTRRIGDILDSEGLPGLLKDAPDGSAPGGRIDDPTGPEAKAQTERLELESAEDEPQMFALRAFHGSPHDFDRFDLSRIGTGEGAQAFGHGLYFAENESVARSYQNVLAAEGITLNGEAIAGDPDLMNLALTKLSGQDLDGRTLDDFEQIARSNLERVQSQPEPTEAEASRYFTTVEAMRARQAQNLAHAQEYLEKVRHVKTGEVKSPGQLYEVEIDVEPERLLDWDKPLSEQGDVGEKALAIFDRLGFTDNPKRTVAQVKQIANEKYGSGTFSNVTVSGLLREAGIPGIRYLDQGSRGAGEGSRNIVLFDDSLVKITKKNGKPVRGKERQDLVDRMFGLPAPEQIKPAPWSGRAAPTSRFTADAEIRDKILTEARKVLPPDWKVHLDDYLTYGGREVKGWADPKERIIYVSMAALDPLERFYEEAGHALRRLIPEADYDILRQEARRLGARGHFRIDERYGEEYGRRWQNNPAKLEDALEEEAIMQMVAAHTRGKTAPGFEPASAVRRILDRIAKFLRKAYETLTGRGYRTYEDVFGEIVSGQMARRALPETERAASLERMRGVMFSMDGTEGAGRARRPGAIRDLINGELAEGRITREDAQDMLVRLEELEAHYRDNPAQAAEQLGDEIDAETAHRLRLRALAEQRQEEIERFMMDFRDERGQPDPARVMIGLLEHHGLVNMPKGFSSAAGRERAIIGTVMARMEGMLAEFSRTRLTGRTRNRARLENVVRELFGEGTGDEAAQQFARMWREVAEDLRQRFNAAGGGIGHLENWGLPQAHNRLALLRAGQERWIADITPQLDLARMRSPLTGNAMTREELRRSLEWIYREITSDGWHDREASMVRRGLGAVANQRGAHRFLIFRNADGWLNYQASYGSGGNPFVTMMNHIRGMARDIADMETFGPNPRAMLNFMQDVVRKHSNQRAAGLPALFPTRTKISGREFAGDGAWTEIKNAKDYGNALITLAEDMYNIRRGHAGAAVNSRVAAVFDALRNLNVANMLGGAFLSAISDVSFQRSARAFADLPQTRMIGDLIRENFSRASRFDAVRAGLILDSAMDQLQDQSRFFGGMQGPAWSRVIADRTLNWSLLQSWTQAGRHAFGKAVMVEFADHAARAFGDLPEGLRSMLQRYGLDAADWDALRLRADGQPHQDLDMLTPMGVWEARQAAGINDTLHERYLEMILQEGEYAVPMGTLQAQARSYGSLRRGVLLDEIRRSAMQFKMFGMTVGLLQSQRIVAQSLLRGVRTGAQIAAGLIIGTTVLGALAIQLKEMSRGKDPRPMTEPAFWLAAVLQGGGFGIFGDFFFSESNRFGGGLAETVAGPTVGNVSQALRLTVGNLQKGIKGEEVNFGREAVRFLGRNTPFSSLWYLRLGFERVFLDTLQELADPEASAAWRRRIQTQKRDYGNDFFWRPGELGPRRGPALENVLGR